MRSTSPVLVATAALALAAFAGAASAQVRHEYNYHNEHGKLATRPLYPVGRADSVRRPGFNGKLWISRPIIGGMSDCDALGWSDPGPAAYGADEYDGSQVHAKVGQVDVAFSPWEYVQGRGNKSLNMARNKWLRERGYTGGVRTFVNDLFTHYYSTSGERVASAETETPSAQQGQVQPRATIHMPLDQPRFRSRMQVNGQLNSGAEAIVKLANADSTLRVSWPDAAPSQIKPRTTIAVTAAAQEKISPVIHVITSGPAVALASAAGNAPEATSPLSPSSEPAPVVSNAEVK